MAPKDSSNNKFYILNYTHEELKVMLKRIENDLFSGDYLDLINKPDIYTKLEVNQLINQLFGSMTSGINLTTNKKSNNNLTKGKTSTKQEYKSILGIKVYQPGENSIDRNLVRKLKWHWDSNG